MSRNLKHEQERMHFIAEGDFNSTDLNNRCFLKGISFILIICYSFRGIFNTILKNNNFLVSTTLAHLLLFEICTAKTLEQYVTQSSLLFKCSIFRYHMCSSYILLWFAKSSLFWILLGQLLLPTITSTHHLIQKMCHFCQQQTHLNGTKISFN
jgi:hypothetical protein